MSDGISELSEFLCLKDKNDPEDLYFNREKTLALINLYKIYKPKLATGEIKSMKRLWEIIATEISNAFKITFLPSKCENRFKVLERNYKKTIDNNNKSGRGRKNFEYESEFNELYGKKLSIIPKILLSSDDTIQPRKSEKINILSVVDIPSTTKQTALPCSSTLPSATVNDNSEVILGIPDDESTAKLTPRKKRKRPGEAYKKRNEILTDIKNDLKYYYDEKLKLEREKLQLRREKMEDRKKRSKLLEKQLG